MTTLSNAGGLAGNMNLSAALTGTIAGNKGYIGPKAVDVFATPGMDEIELNGVAFSGPTVKKYSLPDVTEIGAYAFGYNANVTEIDIPKVTTIGNNAFYNAENLEKINAPKADTVGSSVIIGTKIKKVSLPLVQDIGNALQSAGSVEELELPVLNTVGDSAFSSMSALKKFDLTITTASKQSIFRNCGKNVSKEESEVDIDITISSGTGSYMFNYLTARNLTVRGLTSYSTNSDMFRKMKVKNFSMPDTTSITGYNTFGDCEFETVSMPNVATMNGGNRIFSSVKFSADTELNFPALTSVGATLFQGATGAKSITLPACTSISGSSNLSTFPNGIKDLYLPGATMCTLNSSPNIAFYGTVLLNDEAGRIHVPSDLEADYLEAQNWSDIASKIVGDLPAVNA